MKRRKISKESIIEAAVIIGDKKHISNITLKEIAEYLEIKTPSLYNHISGLDELYDLLAFEGLKRLMAALTDSVIGLSGRDALLSMGNAYRTFAKDSPTYYNAVQMDSIWINQSTKDLGGSVIGLIIKIISFYEFDEEKNVHVVRTLRSYLHGFTQLEMQKSFNVPIDLEDSFETGLKAVLSGFNM